MLCNHAHQRTIRSDLWLRSVAGQFRLLVGFGVRRVHSGYAACTHTQHLVIRNSSSAGLEECQEELGRVPVLARGMPRDEW
jgi:hypothetical protein